MADNIKNLTAPRLTNEQVFCENGTCNRKYIKKRLLKQKILEYKCEDCGIKDTYNGKPISLQLDHKNGINNDNRVCNLRLLCPNCHSQTPTYAGKRLKRQLETDEQKKIRIEKSRKFNPTKEELLLAVHQFSLAKVGRMYGVCDASIKKRCRLLGINWRS